MKRSFLALTLSSLIVGCGGSDSGDNDIQFNHSNMFGVYQIPGLKNFILIDTEKNTHVATLVLNDGDAVCTSTNHVLRGSNLQVNDMICNVSEDEYLEDEYIDDYSEDDVTIDRINIKIEQDYLVLSDQVTGGFLFSVPSINNSLELSELTNYSYYNDGNNSNWTIRESGEFHISGKCNISGSIEPFKGHYITKDATAVSCSDSDFNSDKFSGVVFTAKYYGEDHVFLISTDKNKMLFTSAKINN